MNKNGWFPAAVLAVGALTAFSGAARADGSALDLARASGCLACHSVDAKILGPAWKDVAARYRGNAEARDALIAKVRDGGAGNWKEVTGGIAMPPNGPRVNDADIATLVDFVLSLE